MIVKEDTTIQEKSYQGLLVVLLIAVLFLLGAGTTSTTADPSPQAESDEVGAILPAIGDQARLAHAVGPSENGPRLWSDQPLLDLQRPHPSDLDRCPYYSVANSPYGYPCDERIMT